MARTHARCEMILSRLIMVVPFITLDDIHANDGLRSTAFLSARRCAEVVALTSATHGVAGHKIIIGRLGRVALSRHHLEDRFAVADFLLYGEDRALRRGLLNDG